jgi:predicted porin
MKKQIAMALAASCILGAAGTAFAAEVPNPFDIKFDGSVTLQYRNDERSNAFDPTNNNTRNGFKTTFILNAEKAFNEHFSLYSRLTYQNINGGDAEGPFQDYVDDQYNGAIDAFGFKYNNAGVNYVLGSQAFTLGATGIVYDNGFLGKHALPYALKINGKAGATDLTAIYAKTNYQDDYDNDKFYVLQGQYALNDKTSVGGFYAHTDYGNYTKSLVYNKDSLDYYGVNATYQFTDKLGFVGEYIKSDADRDNKGYIGGLTYAFDKKTTAGLSYYRVEDQAAIVDGNLYSMTTAPFSNASGYIVSVNHKVGPDVTLSASYDTMDKINNEGIAGADNDRNRTKIGVTVSF